MTEPTRQTPANMRATMPRTAAWVDKCRQRFGAPHVNACLRAALSGQAGHFYAVEAGHAVGAPFDWAACGLADIAGADFGAVMARPNGGHTTAPEPVRKGMRDTMPETAAWVDQCRQKFGDLHADQCLRAALAGQRNHFYAVEGGHVLGTPFDWNEQAMYIVSMSVLSGGKFIAAMADPKGGFALTIERADPGQGGASA